MTESPAASELPKQVVVVDDDPVILKVVEHTVRKRGLRCVTFTSPITALNYILKARPDAVITDFNMPSLNGLELIEELRDRMGTEAPPCLILSANPEESVITRAFDAGAADYLCKPFAAGELNVKLRRVLDKSNDRLRRSGLFKVPEASNKIGPYTVVRELGRGGMGVVYEVTHPDYNRSLALKTLTTADTAVEAMLRFRREIDVLTNLAHPGLVRFYGAGKDSGLMYYTMDLVEGESLREHITMEGGMSVHRLAPILYIIGSALGYLHAHELVHRDVTPGNILIPKNGRVRLADFGLAKHIFDNQLTASREMLGTPNYMAPESIVGKPLDGRSDLFALGMCALAALMGETPVQAENPYTVMRQVVAGEFPSAAQFDVPADFAKAIDGLLEVDVESRTYSAGHFLDAITPFVSPHIVAEFGPANQPTSAPIARKLNAPLARAGRDEGDDTSMMQAITDLDAKTDPGVGS